MQTTSVREHLLTAVRLPVGASFRDSDLGLVRSFVGDLQRRGVCSRVQIMVTGFRGP